MAPAAGRTGTEAFDTLTWRGWPMPNFLARGRTSLGPLQLQRQSARLKDPPPDAHRKRRRRPVGVLRDHPFGPRVVELGAPRCSTSSQRGSNRRSLPARPATITARPLESRASPIIRTALGDGPSRRGPAPREPDASPIPTPHLPASPGERGREERPLPPPMPKQSTARPGPWRWWLTPS